MPELLIVGASLAVLFGYHVRLFVRIASNGGATAFGRHRIARAQWLDHYAGSKHEILVVQTLRNWLMSATFLASTSIVIAFGVLGIMTTTDKISGLSRELNMMGNTDTGLLLLKFALVLLLYLAAFFAFTFSVRFFSHASFVVNLPVTDTGIRGQDDLENGALCYFLGLRCLYLSIPLAMWLLGPIGLAVATVLVLAVLFKFD